MNTKKTKNLKVEQEKPVHQPKAKRIAVLTSGGDAPGMNVVISTIIKHAATLNYEVLLVSEGYKGLVEGNFKTIDLNLVEALAAVGGTFIYTSRFPEFQELEVRERAVAQLKAHNVDVLVIIGGDGSLNGANKLSEMGVNCIALPGTIDNDMASSEFTIGFYTALETIGRSVQEIRNTCTSHNRIGLIEVMGRYCGDLALYGGIASGADLIITSENVLTAKEISQVVDNAYKRNPQRRTFIILVSEMIYGSNGNPSLEAIAEVISTVNQKRTAINRLGYIQRGGTPTTMERFWATMMAIHAIELIKDGKKNRMIGQKQNVVVDLPIAEALKMKRPSRLEILKKINGFCTLKARK